MAIQTIIADIAKDIRWDRTTKDFTVSVIIDGASQYIGSRQSRMDAETLANGFVFDYLVDSNTPETAAELLMGVA